jgi:hypothetical protein
MPTVLHGQQKFDPSELRKPALFGADVAAQLGLEEVYEYSKEGPENRVFLKNGFRTSRFPNKEAWLKIRDTVEPYRVDIVYSRYPLRNNAYHEIYPLLLHRIEALIELDPSLNSEHIVWNKVQQTHVVNDAQVGKLFHGIVIWYRTQTELDAQPSDTFPPPENIPPISAQTAARFDPSAFQHVIPDSTVTRLKALPDRDQVRATEKVLEEKILQEPEVELHKATPADLETYRMMVKNFADNYRSRDQVVSAVFNRHPEWKEVLVVNDWTGSMYGYGSQVLEWHLEHFRTSGIRSLVLFNDGDKKSTYEKKIGHTGGVYMERADNIVKMVSLFNLVMMRGSGGDRAENDIEAVLTALQRYPHPKELVLIADNNACIRDMELADSIRVPIHIIICGYLPAVGINPQLVVLAKKTNGTLYTVDQDISNIRASVNKKGNLQSMSDSRFLLSTLACEVTEWRPKAKDTVYTNFKVALLNDQRVKRLQLASRGYTEVPGKISKLEWIYELDLSRNLIREIPRRLTSLVYIKRLDLSFNRLTAIPAHIERMHAAEHFDLSNNRIGTVPEELFSLTTLKRLDLSSNAVKTIQGDNNARRLEFLNLSNNLLTELPHSFYNMRRLMVLNLSQNSLTSLPDQLLGFTRLEELNLNGNKLTKLPVKLWKLKRLRVLRLEDNLLPEEEKDRIRKALPAAEIYF